jgi:copper chaperone CopZ
MAAALCCIAPLGAVVLSLGGWASLNFFAKWRPVLLGVSFTWLIVAWYLAFRTAGACSQSVTCATSSASKWNKVVLSLATVLILGAAGLPRLLSHLEARIDATSLGQSSGLSTLRVKIPSMDCNACAVLIQKKIREQTGIASATVSFQEREAIVRYKPGEITPAKIISTIDETGFKAEPRNKGVLP